MSDLSSLTADQLAENVRDSLGGPDYAPMDRRWVDVAADAGAALAELQTRANQLPEALKVGRAQRLYAAERRAEAAEKERDEARRVVDVLKRYWRRAEARLAETLKALERIVAAADADAALNLRDVAFIARAALTTHPADDDDA